MQWSAIVSYYRFRIKQITREINALGFVYFLLVAAVFVFLNYLSWVTIQNANLSYYTLFLFLPALALVFYRQDLRFLKKFTHSFRWILALDYMLILLPVLLIATLKQEYKFAVYALVCILFFTFFPGLKTVKSGRAYHFRQLSAFAFEWKAGLRKHGIFVLTLSLSSLLLAWAPAVTIVLQWLLHSVIISFYQTTEGGDILRTHNSSANSLLIRKTGFACKYQFLLQVVPFGLYLVFHVEHFWIIGLFLLLSVISLVFTIVTKYSYYEAGAKTQPSSVLQAVGMISFLIPFLVPVPLVLSIIHYQKALRKLERNGITN